MRQMNSADVRTWLAALDDWSNGQPLRAPEFVKPYQLVTLALTAKRRGKAVSLTLPEDLQGYAARMELWEAAGVDPPVEVPKRDPSGRFLPAQPLRDRHRVLEVTDKLVEIAPDSTEIETRDSLGYVIHELVENCFYHSAPDDELFGLACAQAWIGGDLAQVAIADPGIGIRKTLAENPDYREALATRNACQFATEYGVSGKAHTGHHSGYGMTLARDALERSGGKFLVVSQTEIVECSSAGSYPSDRDRQWAGTLVIIEWRLDRPINVKAVYDAWPDPEGLTDDDFDF